MAPVYPPGVLQKMTIPDPTTKGGYLEITHFPEPVPYSYEDFDIEEFATRDEQLAEILCAAEKDHFAELDRKIRILGETLQGMEHYGDTKWYSRSDPWSKPGVDVVPLTNGKRESQWPKHRTWAHLMLWPLDDSIAEVLDNSEQDRDYEELLNSKEYQKSLKDYNRHRLLAWEKFSDDNRQHPKWSGQGTQSDKDIDWAHLTTHDAFLKERYRVEVDVWWHSIRSDWAHGTTPYGDVYVPNKIAKWIRNGPGCYEMEIALQDVKGSNGKKPNSFRWTCVYLHNKGHSLE